MQSNQPVRHQLVKEQAGWDLQKVLNILADERIRFEGPTKLLAPNLPNIKSEAALVRYIEGLLVKGGDVRGNAPLTYWKGVISDAISLYKKMQLKEQLTLIAYDGTSKDDSRLQAFVNLIVADPSRST